MNKWDTRFIELARTVATWSKDPDHKVGAVLTTKENKIVSTGFNGFPKGMDYIHSDKQGKLFKTVHAEVNCLLNNSTALTNLTMYISRCPCAQCAAMIVQARVTRVVCPMPELDSSWLPSMTAALEILDSSRTEIDFI